MGYISFPISATPDDILASAYDYIKQRAPEWLENDGNLDTWILQAMAMEASDLRELALDVPDAIFRYYGGLVGIPPINAAAATVNSTWVVSDNLGHTIPAGTQVAIRDGLGNLVPFVSTADVFIAAGATTTAAGEVVLQAVDPGSAATGLGGSGITATLLDTLAWVTSVTLTGATTGGVDAETASDYNNRLADQLTLMANRPILPGDFAIMAQQIPGVYRALAVDGWNAQTSTGNQDRTISVAAVDNLGNAVSSAIKTQIDNLLQANREINFLVFEMDPTYTSIQVTTTVKALPSTDFPTLSASIVSALQQYFDPSNWGIDPSGGDNTSWVTSTVVRYNEVITAIAAVPGVDYVSALQIGPQPGSLGTTDINLTGQAPLTRAGTITPTVT